MTRQFHLSRRSLLGLIASTSLLFGSTVSSFAQKPQSRIAGEVTSERVVMPKSQPPLAKFAQDVGSLAPGTTLNGMSLVFNRSAAQEADLQALIAAQQNPASPQYHAWLTPDQFAARFGMSDADLAKAQTWLEQQGFTVDAIARSKNRITFSGTAAQAQSAFNVQLHNYRVGNTTRFAPAGDISLPAALSGVVQSVANLSNFRPHSHMRVQQQGQVVPTANFTSGQTGSHFLTPGDVETIYDIKAVQNAGFNGAGQSIAVMGQSSITLTDIENFESAAGLTKKDPTLILVPNTGASTVYTGDESESDLDLEYSGAIAPGATIYFVYAGATGSVTDSIAYAVDNNIAPIISTSYGGCETEYSATEYAAENSVFEQAASQGQTVIAAAGDDGSTDCYGITSLTTAQQQALSVDFPASSQYVTAMGGTEFSAANIASTNTTYWTAANGSDVISSALSYIPEQVWNDDSSTIGISAGGGGASVLNTTRPTWQANVPGIPSGTTRLVPDISLAASPNNPGYLYCTSDTASWSSTTQQASCNSGFRDSSSQLLTVAGGTSFTVPIFAGMVAMINQATGQTGQGVVNPTLYALAANATTYTSAFHDITVGNNACLAGTAYCSTAAANTSLYAAGPGYDEASGLGSLDFNNLLTAWKAAAVTGSSSLLATTTTVTAASTSPASGAADVITISVAPSTGTGTPTGTVTILVDGTPVSPAPTLSSGTTTYSFSSTTDGPHVIRVTYSGDGNYAPSTNTLVINVGATFTIAAAPTSITVASGSSGTSTITVTPVNGYTGTIDWTVSSSPSTLVGCYSIGSTAGTTIVSGAPVTATLTLYTSSTSSACASSSLAPSTGSAKFKFAGAGPQASRGPAPAGPRSPGTGAGIALAGLLFCGLCGSRSRKLRVFLALAVISVATLSTFGCGSSSSTTTTGSTTGSATAGTYVLTVTGTDSASTKSAQATITLTVQ